MRLTKKQSQAIEELFQNGGDETIVCNNLNISPQLWQKWLNNKNFQQAVENRIQAAKQNSKILLAKYIPLAAAKLVQLCSSDKDETSRKAALDILALQTNSNLPAENNGSKKEPDEKLDPIVAAKIMQAVAESKK